MIEHGKRPDMTPTERMLFDAHFLLEQISRDFILLRRLPDLDPRREAAIEMEAKIAEFLDLPLFKDEVSNTGASDG